MNNLNNNHFNILDLPDEILFIIFHKLNMVDVLYSLVDVNQRFHRLALDSLYVRDLNMTDIMIINSLYDRTSSVDSQVLSRICSKILPRIHHQIQKLTIEEFSVKQILHVSNYPQLYSLSLINFREETLNQYLTGIRF
jgi:F-box-like